MLIADPLSILLVSIAALALDAWLGEPDWLWSRVRHPVVVIGQAVGWLEEQWNRAGDSPSRRRMMGVLTVALIVLGGGLLAAGLHRLLALIPFGLGIVGEIVVVAILLAGRSLHEHVAAVRRALDGGGLAAGRAAVALIVGRSPDTLDEAGVGRAAIESNAENYADGVIAPLFWFLVLGLPGIVGYKTVNTLDSMIGHRSPRYRDFGWAAARLDDVANWPPARLTALLFVAAAAIVPRTSPVQAIRACLRDAGRHTSVNAGWPEAAMAGALDLALAGPRTYGTEAVAGAWMNADGRRDAGARDIARSLRLTVVASLLVWTLLIVAGVLMF
ncbi:adenosylcobinamide-phosphate synthase CbiB [Fodinicurvata sp. EGI_FJ10296]|uniref:adenosylcobinamide-phosphate synthase CbiB n=1 Tax=Fodinicurvata sp. EGI_FJ10296 TaxID=3231908 RepID=UPI00345644C8